MSYHLTKKALLKKTALVSILTIMSRMLGILREILLASYLGIGVLSDAFITAFKIPNFFRHIFAEGALSASFVPHIVGALNESKKEDAQGLMTLSFIFFEGIVLSLYALLLLWTPQIITLLAPGFNEAQIAHTIPLSRIMFLFLFFVSSSALFAGALQAVNHFFAPAFGPVLWNMIYVLTIQAALSYLLPSEWLAAGVVGGGAALFVLHYYFFKREGFSFSLPTKGSWLLFRAVLKTFLPCLAGVSIVELNLFVGGYLVSYLPAGSTTLLYYGQRFLNIPIGIFAVAIANTLLSHFSRIVGWGNSRFSFYLLEGTKLVTWVILPMTLFLAVLSPHFFSFMLASKRAAPEQIVLVSSVFIVYLAGLLFLCLNKIFLSLLYALKDTRATTRAAGISALVNILGDLVAVFYCKSIYGIAAANGLSAAVMSGCLLYALAQRHKIWLHVKQYALFFLRYTLQLVLVFSALNLLKQLLVRQSPIGFEGFLFWLTFFVTMAVTFVLLWATRRLFGVRVYFLNR